MMSMLHTIHIADGILKVDAPLTPLPLFIVKGTMIQHVLPCATPFIIMLKCKGEEIIC